MARRKKKDWFVLDEGNGVKHQRQMSDQEADLENRGMEMLGRSYRWKKQ
jgi:hypothetical protein